MTKIDIYMYIDVTYHTKAIRKGVKFESAPFKLTEE
jgi:hypothetical protein